MDTLQKILRVIVHATLVIAGLAMVALGVWMLASQKGVDAGFTAGFETLRQAVSAGIPSVSPDAVDGGYNGQVVYLYGPLEYEPVTDPVTGVRIPAGGLRRIVEMNQWKEEVVFRGGKDKRLGSQL